MLVLWLTVMLGCGGNWTDQEACQEYWRAQCDCGVYDEDFCAAEDFEATITDQCSNLSEKEGSDEQQSYDECAIDGYRESCEWESVYETCCEQYPGAADCG